eukprot:TRINITY_DN16476_c0_g1_i1.p1 TRINITY_DN16476_c0_g1~~TRINITY_DN16476_c0_g1_i1.p1  ORF type:complete len:317 (-),score=0.17 TRINITY_DN16476_c0_g1_i1:56-1006(-)
MSKEYVHTTTCRGKEVGWRYITAADKQAVTDLSVGIYAGDDGLPGDDSLPVHWDEWMNNPNYVLFGAEIEGQLRGFWCHRTINEGRTVYTMHARVHPEWRNSGLNAGPRTLGAKYNWPPMTTETHIRWTQGGDLKAGTTVVHKRAPHAPKIMPLHGILYYHHSALYKLKSILRNLQGTFGKEDTTTSNYDSFCQRAPQQVVWAWTPHEKTSKQVFSHFKFYESTSGVSLGNEDTRVNGLQYVVNIFCENMAGVLAHLLAFLEQEAVKELYPWFVAFIPLELAKTLVPLLPKGSSYHGTVCEWCEIPVPKGKPKPKL